MKHPDYPGVSSFKDNRGIIRWRFRKTGLKPCYLPGEPHSREFDAIYQAAIEGRAVRQAPIIKMPGAAYPTSLNAAWCKLQETAKWKKLDRESQSLYARYVEEFLRRPIGSMTAGDGPVADLRPRHIAAAMDDLADKPHKAKLLLIGLKKLMKVAILQEWIEYDPTYGIEPPDTTTDGHLAWPAHICAKFELRWPIGTQARTAYALALWMGNRRSDIALLRWDQLTTRIIASEDGLRRSVEGFAFIQFKGRNRKGTGEIFIPITPMLAESLAPLPRGTETVLTRQDGQPYNYKSLTAMMWHWRKAASIEGKYSLHGLRKALGGMLADAEATGHQSKDVLGHRSMAEVDRYSRSRNRAAGSVTGMEKVVKLVRG